MKFRFPIVIIDEDFRSENTSGLGIRALADAIETEGMEVLGVTSYGDLSQFAQQQSRASAFILSIDDEEFGAGTSEETDYALKSLRAFVEEIRYKMPTFLSICTAKPALRAIFQTIFCANCMASFTCSKIPQNSSHAISFARRARTWIVWHHHSSVRWFIMRTMAPTPGTALGIQVAWRF